MESLHLWILVALEASLALLTVGWIGVVCQKKPRNRRIDGKQGSVHANLLNSSQLESAPSKKKVGGSGKSKREAENASNGPRSGDKKSGKDAPKPPMVPRSSESGAGDKASAAGSTKAPENTPNTAATLPTENPEGAGGTGSSDTTHTKPLPSAKIGALPEDGRPKIEKTVILSLRHKEHDTGMNVGSERSKKSAKESRKEKKEASLKLDQTELSMQKEREDQTQSPKGEKSRCDEGAEKEQEVDANE